MIFKRTLSRLLSVALAIAFLMVVTTREAHAYIDVGAANFLFQMLAASALAGLFALKMYWYIVVRKIKRVFVVLKRRNTTED